MIPALGSALPRLGVDTLAGVQPGAPAASSAATKAAGADFSAVMSQVASEAMGSLKAAEAVSIQGVNGSASTQAVVEAVMNAERTLQTAVAVRDKVVSAYLELSRMQI
jgi:flagellar hook-basal body complex protein FliE